MWSVGGLSAVETRLAVNCLERFVMELSAIPVWRRKWSEHSITTPLYWLDEAQRDMTRHHWSESKLARRNRCKALPLTDIFKSHSLLIASVYRLVFLLPAMDTCDGSYISPPSNAIPKQDKIPDPVELPGGISDIAISYTRIWWLARLVRERCDGGRRDLTKGSAGHRPGEGGAM